MCQMINIPHVCVVSVFLFSLNESVTVMSRPQICKSDQNNEWQYLKKKTSRAKTKNSNGEKSYRELIAKGGNGGAFCKYH